MYKFLIATEEKGIRNQIRAFAEAEAYVAAETEDGMSVVNMCKEQDFDIIVMDVTIPRLDGI